MITEDFSFPEKRLKTLKAVTPNSTWKTGLRTILVSKMAVKKGITLTPLSWSSRVALIGSAIILMFFGGAVLSARSLPGNHLYSIKRLYEDLRLNNANRAEKIQLQQEYTKRRIVELSKLAQLQKKEVTNALTEVKNSVLVVRSEVASVANEYQTLTSQGRDTTQIRLSLESLAPKIEESQAQLNQIQEILPEEEQGEASELVDSLEKLEIEVKEAIYDSTPTDQDPKLTPSEPNL